MTSPTRTTPSRTPALPVRLTLVPPDTGPHRLDGAWWPRSHDLARELPVLLAALEHRWPHITRVTVGRTMWRTEPRRLLLGDRVLHITRSEATRSPSAICLLSYGVGRCDLLVVPPGAMPAEGHRLMTAAPGFDDPLSADTVSA